MGERAAKWFRVSSGGQDEANQSGAVDRHCAQRGYEVVKTFTLHGDSAYKGKQEPELAEVLEDIRQGRYTVVVIAHSSRLDRRDPDLQAFYALSVRLAGGRIESAREPDFGKATLSGRLVSLLAQQANHDYSRTLSQNVRAAHARIDANGAWRGRIPWGYATTGPKYGKQLVPTDEGRELVPLIFTKIADGESCATVAAWLQRQDDVSNRRVWPKSVAELVRRPVYMGLATDSQGRVVHRCEGLVDAVLWKRANDRLDSPPRRGPSASEPAMLKGAAVCGECGGVMLRIDCGNRHVDGSRTQILYYRCSGAPGPQRKGCGVMVRLETVDRTVDKSMRTIFADQEVMETKVIPGSNHDSEITALKFQLTRLDPDLEDYDQRHAELRKQLAGLRSLPAEPDRVERVGTGVTWAEVWSVSDDSFRAKWMKAQGTVVKLWRDHLRIENGESGWTVPLAA